MNALESIARDVAHECQAAAAMAHAVAGGWQDGDRRQLPSGDNLLGQFHARVAVTMDALRTAEAKLSTIIAQRGNKLCLKDTSEASTSAVGGGLRV